MNNFKAKDFACSSVDYEDSWCEIWQLKNNKFSLLFQKRLAKFLKFSPFFMALSILMKSGLHFELPFLLLHDQNNLIPIYQVQQL